MSPSESYPEELLYNAEHDWARIEGDEAVLGITWFAADALGELVHFEPPETGSSVTKDQSYGEVETVNEDPYGNGWLLRIRLADPGEVDVLLDVDAYRQVLANQ